MTVWGLLGACRRAWLLVVIGLALTAGVVFAVARDPGVYWAQTNVTFLQPPSTRYPNPLSAGSGSLIATAGLVEREVNNGTAAMATVSASITLVDEGVLDGTMIQLPNSGGQWAYNFARPVLDVQAVASTPNTVRQRMAKLQSSIQTTLDRLQDEAGVDTFDRITLQPSPIEINIRYSRGDPHRAAAVSTLLGVGLTIAAVVVVERRRRAHRSPPAALLSERPRPVALDSWRPNSNLRTAGRRAMRPSRANQNSSRRRAPC